MSVVIRLTQGNSIGRNCKFKIQYKLLFSSRLAVPLTGGKFLFPFKSKVQGLYLGYYKKLIHSLKKKLFFLVDSHASFQEAPKGAQETPKRRPGFAQEGKYRDI